MKKVLLTIAAIALLAAPATAQKFSLWTDATQSACDVTLAAPYTPFHVVVFLEPGIAGAFAVEYKLATPEGHFSPGGNVIAPFVSGATIGNWFGAPGISAPFTSCQTELVWIINLNMMAPNTTAGYYTMELNDNSLFMGVAICPGTRPLVDGTALNHFGFNTGCIIGTEESSWGAIKSMF
ncbi:MAG: hypothetical protein PHQ19_09005 [Candidatus Krumholzibacteria bacterium]|nr:hypothetical protein [Candidatus Krumholzibacteria bacterium]